MSMKMSTAEEKTGVWFLCAKFDLKTKHTSLLRNSYNLITIGRKTIKNGHMKTPIGGSEHLTSVH